MIYASDSVQERKEEIQIVLPTDTFLHHIRMGMTEEVEADIKNILMNLPTTKIQYLWNQLKW